jgi:hypothetical protein
MHHDLHKFRFMINFIACFMACKVHGWETFPKFNVTLVLLPRAFDQGLGHKKRCGLKKCVKIHAHFTSV